MSYVHPPPDLRRLLSENGARLADIIGGAVDDGEYLHWDKLRHLKPPKGLSREEWWLGLKLGRLAARRELPLSDISARPFSFTLPDRALALLHSIDKRCAGEIAMDEVVTSDEQARHRHLVNSLMEESIRSSQLEGATTSRRVAKEMLHSGREPADRSERMIVNNYRATMFTRDIGETLTPEGVLELHRIVTEGAIDPPDAAGRLQRPGEERVAVLDRDGGRVLHLPPPAEQLPSRLDAICAFANGGEDGPFVHPVMRAIVLHFAVGHDHPFADGNGRTARALFYWAMRRQGYWLVDYLSISRILRQAPARYARAYLLSETDDGDVTHFALHQLEVIDRAIEELHRYLKRKVAEVREVERLVREGAGLNHRQLALVGHALRGGAGSTYTFGVHAKTHGVTHETARSDLRDLAERGLLDVTRVGRQYRFSAPADLADRLRRVRR